MSADRPRVHIIGAGLSGLSCAVALSQKGFDPVLYESTDHAGGRCRSFVDSTLGCHIDNGNHLLLSGNRAALSYLETTGGLKHLTIAPRAFFPFLDLRDGKRWAVDINAGPFPWWIFSPSRRVPGSSPLDYLAALRLMRAGKKRVEECFDRHHPLYERFWEPLALGVLNTSAEEGAAALLWPVLKLTFGKGAGAARPCFPREGLSSCFIDPALHWLKNRGHDIHYQRRLRALEKKDDGVIALDFGTQKIVCAAGDRVVLALPSWGIGELLPEITVPTESRPIVNIHFRLSSPAQFPEKTFLLGIIGGHSQWIFLRGPVASVTISAAEDLAGKEAESLAPTIWGEVRQALALPPTAACPPWRVVKEKRATFAQTPEQLGRRPATQSFLANLCLAGDWTDTGLPATMEGAILSGQKAARAIIEQS